MSGWLDWIEEEIICQFCRKKFIALFCQDDDPNRDPLVITTLAGNKTECPSCRKKIVDDDIEERNNYFAL